MNSKQSETMSNKKDSSASTGVDTIIGRIVVDQGLATVEEVHLCLELQKQHSTEEDEKGKSLADLLMENDFVTSRQLTRVRKEAEAQKTNQQIPGYVIKRKLGAGAMAKVYLARQLSLDRNVAIKVLPGKFNSNVQFIERFYKEGQAAAKLNHSNIVQAYDVGQAGEYHYFIMEYVDGKTVYEEMEEFGKYSEERAIELIIQIAEALQHAHDQGFVHRDVKPKNIMITTNGIAKLADMGLARALSDKEAAEAEAGRAFGTPYYISPEQIRGEINIGPQADIYSLGATFYHMITGQVPFDGENPSSVMHKHLKADFIPPDHINSSLSPGISEVVEMMMAKSRRERYHSCKDLISDLKQIQANQSPGIAHKDYDLSGLASGTYIEGSDLEDTTVSPALSHMMSSSGFTLLNHPGFLLLLTLFIISIMGNAILLLIQLSGG